MNKTKMILMGTGGAIGLAVLVLAFLVWQAFSAKTAAIEGDDEEGVDGLETVEARAQTLSRKPVYPCAASVNAIGQNQKQVDDWFEEGLKLASRGDRVYVKTTPAQFKTDLGMDAKRLMALPGGAQGKLTKPDFAFGPFKGYIAEGVMPAEQELADLQRKWDDVSTITEMLATNGITELVDIQFKAQAAEAPEAPKRSNARNGRQAKKAKPSAKADSAVRPFDELKVSRSYVFTFTARPPAFVKVLNELGSCERFVTVDSFTFARPVDVIAETLSGDEKKNERRQSSGRGRRGRRGEAAAEPEEKKSESKNGVITDPLHDEPLTVTLTVTVHDFRSLEAEKSEEEGK